MRFGRWLLLATILGIAGFVYESYIERKNALAKSVPPPPTPLETGVDGRANDWVYTESDGTRPKVTVRAKSFRQIKAPSQMELHGVELQLYHKDGLEFDLVRSEQADFDILAKTLYSEGEVEIAMGVPVKAEEGLTDTAQLHGRILKVHSSGVHFSSDNGNVWTDRAASFVFDDGSGSAVGAVYMPLTRELHLAHNVVLDLKDSTAGSKPMHIEAGEAYYREAESKVILLPWSKLTRPGMEMVAEGSVVSLNKGAITRTDSQKAQGHQDDGQRRVEFQADNLTLEFADDNKIRTITAVNNSKLVSTANAMQTTVVGDRLTLDFDPTQQESMLQRALAIGNSSAEARPLERPGELTADTRILRSEVIHLNMRPGGSEIANMETDGAGTVEFLPNRAGQPKRLLKGDHIWLNFGAENRLQSFRSINASTRTEKPAVAGKAAPPPMLTESKEIVASFEEKTGELARLEQKKDFRYEEGTRRATSENAVLDPAKNIIILEGAARAWDSSGQASADRLTLDQASGDMLAEGRVSTTRVPDPKPTAGSAPLLSTTETMQGRADRMTSSNNNQKLHYEGKAVVWQGANRVQADRIDIDRTSQIFEARGNVISQFADQNKNANAKKGAPLVFTVVRAPQLTYRSETRLAEYQGGNVLLTRPELNVSANRLQAYMKESGSGDSLDKAIGDGAVKIVSSASKRTRTGTGEHSEYYAGEQKVVLSGGEPLLIDTVRGQTKGRQLTWWSNNDRLLVDGVESRPADTLLRKK